MHSTHRAVATAAKCGVRDWCSAHLKSKWLWGGHVARRDGSTWLSRVVGWRDSAWQDSANQMGHSRPVRPSKRRWMKWEDVLRRYCSIDGLGSWKCLAANRDDWMAHTAEFVRFCRATGSADV
eukprot:4133186-Karenia_brevis.AAC.1